MRGLGKNPKCFVWLQRVVPCSSDRRVKHQRSFQSSNGRQHFFIYSSIFLEWHLSRTRELLKYMDIMRCITRFGGYNWWSYVQFQLRQARQPQWSQDVINMELWLTVAAVNAHQSYTRRHPFQAYDRVAIRATLPRKRSDAACGPRQGLLCLLFNKHGAWYRANCSHGHQCLSCGAASPDPSCARTILASEEEQAAPIRSLAPTPIRLD